MGIGFFAIGLLSVNGPVVRLFQLNFFLCDLAGLSYSIAYWKGRGWAESGEGDRQEDNLGRSGRGS